MSGQLLQEGGDPQTHTQLTHVCAAASVQSADKVKHVGKTEQIIQASSRNA